jgi:hypothetical protein
VLEEAKPFELHIFFVDGPVVFQSDKIPCATAEEARALWERQYSTRRYGAIYSVAQDKRVRFFAPTCARVERIKRREREKRLRALWRRDVARFRRVTSSRK